ncbi:MAG: TonB-dependent siderophore receptor [Candidatus Andeanibacterium colombiense]|uniref:TonB-dependent siderophore receptor n=1 Tax=Candidatus Andeanibacterium colombiense TaxID=3121345 RepID=A0AAJ6BN18_9SPHN|nr:MAG: TonB-dependent siderophore receptor [Sphingomonadaceae bacterium]
MSLSSRSQSAIRLRRNLLAAVSLGAAAALAGIAAPAAAQADAAQKAYQVDLPSQSLSRSLAQLSQITGLQLIYTVSESDKATAPALNGRMTADQALGRLISGSGFTYRYLRPGVITLERTSAGGNGDGEVVTGAVQVEGVQGSGSPYFGGAGQAAGVNGVNGSRDITATEGTGSFTSGALTIGSKVPQALKDVPQSISVLTSERLEQQNVTDFTSAMRQLPGVTLVQGDTSLETTFYSRGFAINSIQVDGGAPLYIGFGYYPQIDMSVYDHVELLRGASGLLNGYGDPSGSVNLVRKKPLDHAQVTLEAQAGSWQTYRVVADATAPLALDGKLRGRLVMTYQANHYFYDTAKDNKTLVYGIAELDLTPTTLVSAGVNYTRQDSVPWNGGLPRYQNGDDLALPRSTCLCFGWNRWDFDTTEIFGSIEQKIGEDWMVKFNLTRNRQSNTRKLGYSSGAVNSINLLGPALGGIYNDFSSSQFSAEAVVNGEFELFGQHQEISIGANRVKSDGGGWTNYSTLISGTATAPYQPYPGGPTYYSGSPNGSRPPVDVFDFDPSDPLYTEPRNPLPSGRYPVNGQLQWGMYANLRLTAFDKLHLTTGLRWSQYQSKYTFDALCTGTVGLCAGKQIGDTAYSYGADYRGHDFSWPPQVNLSYDITPQLSAYAGYTDIYRNLANYLSADLKPLAPLTGSNWEGGLKWAARDGKLNVSLAAYRIRQHGFPAVDPPDYSGYYEVSPGVYCCFVSSPDQTLESTGFDLEATGEVLPGWQVTASYTYNKNKQVGAAYGGAQGIPFTSIQPKHLYKIWMSYDFGPAGAPAWLSKLTLSGGLNGQSSAYYSGAICRNFAGAPDPISGFQDCLTYDVPDYVPFDFKVPAYALLAARIDYRFSANWSLAASIENILDKTYYQTVSGSPDGGNWYGAPRSVTATLRAKW